MKGDKVSLKGSNLEYEVVLTVISKEDEVLYDLKDVLNVKCQKSVKESDLLFRDVNNAVSLRGIIFDSHESDLYIPTTEVTKKIIENYVFSNNVTSFVSELDGNAWYEIPFANNDFWSKKEKKCS